VNKKAKLLNEKNEISLINKEITCCANSSLRNSSWSQSGFAVGMFLRSWGFDFLYFSSVASIENKDQQLRFYCIYVQQSILVMSDILLITL
jgi:hypothetical protein